MLARAICLVFVTFYFASVNGQAIDANPLINEMNMTAARLLEKMDNVAKKMQSARIIGDFSYTETLLKIGDYKYWVSEVNMDWWNANYICIMRNGRLASKGIRDEEVLPLIWEYIINLDKDDAPGAWIGLHDLITESNWVWVDGVISTSSNTKWNSGSPHSYYTNEDCAQLSQDLTYIDDTVCTYTRRALCEFDA